MRDSTKTKEELITELESLRACLDTSAQGRDRHPEAGSMFKQILDDLPQMVYETDRDGWITYVNHRVMDAFGYSATEIKNGVNVERVIHPDDLDRAKGNMARAMGGQGSQGEDYLAMRKDGSLFPIKIYSQGVFAGGTPVGVRGTVVDMTEAKQSEEALRKSENYYRTLFENTGTAMALFGENALIISCNSQFATLSGYPVGAVINKMEWMDFARPEDIGWIQERTKAAIASISKQATSYRCIFVTCDGTEKQIQVYFQIIPETHNCVCSLIDLTDVVQAEEALRKSERYYRTLFSNTGTAMIIYGNDSIIRSCNARFEDLSGYSAREIEGAMKWSDFVAPEELERMTAYHEGRIVTGNTIPADYEFNFSARNTQRKVVHVYVQYVPETRDRACSLIDITDRKMAEQALKKSDERYELVVRGANDGIWDWSLQTNAVYYSPRYKAILGYADDEFPNIADSWKNNIHPDDLDHTIAANMNCVEGKADQFEVEFRMLHKNGTYRWILGRGAGVRDKSGKVYRLSGTHTDITARKRQERTTQARYAIAKAIDTSHDMQHLYEEIHAILDDLIHAKNFFIALLDEERDCITFPYFRDEKDSYRDIPNASSPETRSLTTHVLRTGEPLFVSSTNPLSQKPKDIIGIIGTPAEVWLGVPLKLGGKVVGAMAVQHYSDPRHYSDADVSLMNAASEQVARVIERKANEEAMASLNEGLENMVELRTAELQEKASQLEEANKRLTELDKIKSTLVSSISHELRTPLTSIRGFAKLTGRDFLRFFHPLSDTPLLQNKGDRIANNLEIIESEGERLTRLINDFLDINRIESGKAAWNDDFLNPCEVIRHATNALAGAFAAKPEVSLVTDLPDTVPTIHADPDKMQQVLINLLHNACKFTSEGTVTVSVTANLDTLTVTVTDTGMGIAKEEQKDIFEKFHKSRAGDTISIKDKGTGLGLAICREIVEHYGGSIWVESTEDDGSAFSFTLPTIPGSETSCI